MAKRDFTEIAAARVYDKLEASVEQDAQDTPVEEKTRKDRKTYSQQEIREFQNEMKTQGRKNAKLKRINLAFSAGNYDFIATMSRVSGESMTQFVNRIVDDYRTQHADLYFQAIDFRNRL